MGLFSGSTSFVRFKAEGELPDNFWEFADEQIKLNIFRDIDDNFEEQSIGWVSILNMFDSSFEYASYAAGDYLVMSLRVDERKVSPAVLNKFCLKEEERLKKEKEIPRLNRRQRLEIKENVRLMLVKKSMPVPAVYDLSWNLSDGTLLFFSTSVKAQEILEDFFKRTFGLQLVLQVPYLVAGHLLEPQEQDNLTNIMPEILI